MLDLGVAHHGSDNIFLIDARKLRWLLRIIERRHLGQWLRLGQRLEERTLTTSLRLSVGILVVGTPLSINLSPFGLIPLNGKRLSADSAHSAHSAFSDQERGHGRGLSGEIAPLPYVYHYRKRTPDLSEYRLLRVVTK